MTNKGYLLELGRMSKDQIAMKICILKKAEIPYRLVDMYWLVIIQVQKL